MSNTRKSVYLAIIFLFLLVAFLPLRLALAWSGLSEKGVNARDVSGTIWSGSIMDLQVGQLSLGNLDASVSPLGLLVGQTRLALERPNEATLEAPLSLTLGRGNGGFSVRNGNGEVSANGAFAPLPVSVIAANDLNIIFGPNGCDSASGSVRVQLEQSLLGFSIQRGLTGNVRCDGAALLIPLKGESGLEQLDMRIRQDGSYVADLVLQGVTGPVAAGLALAGFRTRGDSQILQIEGQF